MQGTGPMVTRRGATGPEPASISTDRRSGSRGWHRALAGSRRPQRLLPATDGLGIASLRIVVARDTSRLGRTR
jgi:hypothetical protein